MLTIHYFNFWQPVFFSREDKQCFFFNWHASSFSYFLSKVKMTFENRLTLSVITVRFPINNLLGTEKNLRTKCCWCRLNSVTSDLLIKLLLHTTQCKQRPKNDYFSLNTVYPFSFIPFIDLSLHKRRMYKRFISELSHRASSRISPRQIIPKE